MYKKTILAVCVAAVLPLMVGCDNDDDNTVVQPPIELPKPPTGTPGEVGPGDALHSFTSAVLFEQDNQIADHDDLDPGTGSMSLSFFFKAPATSGTHQVVRKGNLTGGDTGYNVFIANDFIYFRSNIAGVKSDAKLSISDLSPDSWHHFVGVINQDSDTGKMELWVDGVKATEHHEGPSFTPAELNTPDAVIVTQNDGGQVIDDLRFFNRVLTQAEVDSFVNESNQPPEAAIISSSLGGKKFLFYGDVSDPEGEEMTYRWDMGDGTIYNSFSFEHEYQYGGRYTVKLAVSDPWRAETIVEQSFEVEGEPSPYYESVAYRHGEGAYACYRIPTIVKSGNGDLLAFAEGRTSSCADHGNIDVVMRRSTDNGKTWGAIEQIADFGDKAAQNMSAVYDEFYPQVDTDNNPILDEHGNQKMGQMVLVWNNADGNEHQVASELAERRAMLITSLDHGETWSAERDITDAVRIPDQTMHIPPTGHAIQLTTPQAETDGVHGRLFFAGQYSPEGQTSGVYNQNYAFWSDDHGETWVRGTQILGENLNEVQAVELANGHIMFNSRNYRPTANKRRAVTITEDYGVSYGPTVDDDELITPTVASTILRYTREDMHDKNRLLFANPASTSGRQNMTVRMSYDEGENWTVSRNITTGPSAYSDLVIQEDMNIGLLWEDNVDEIRYSSFDLEWLTEGKDTLDLSKFKK
ncbi:exo-alpha-sialidase [Endozoicomonas elysicola]|uniref:exo-alpha-sialidase n=1 Tax=Endozoicomonas elysicola TaxID=305900 RepID=UPI00039AF7F3|nr:exo-alpha-sialidase [Endozoicomonas elysicola]